LHRWLSLQAPVGAFLFEAGFRPGGRLTFLSRYKKVSKEKRPNVRDPFAALRGNLRRGGCGVRRETHFALRATFKQSRRVR